MYVYINFTLKNLIFRCTVPWIFGLVHGFFKKWPKNHPKFLLHFLIHIDVLMLCSKFELIPTSIFRVTAILRK